MPATVEPPVQKQTSPAAAAIAAKAAEAAKQAGAVKSDQADFGAALQAAINTDLKASGQTPPPPGPAGTPPPDKAAADKAAADKVAADAAAAAKATADKAAADKELEKADIPGVLLGDKPKAKKETPDTISDADHQKMIDEETKDLSPAAAKKWKVLADRAKAAEQKAAALAKAHNDELAAIKAKLEAAEKTAAAKPEQTELERLKAQLEEMDAVIQKAALSENPSFRAKYDGGIANEIETLKTMLPAEVHEEVAQLLELPPSKKRKERLLEIGDSLDGIEQAALKHSTQLIDRLAIEKANQLKNWKENKPRLEAIEAQKREEDNAHRAVLLEDAWKQGVANLTGDQGMEIFRKVEGEDEWNAAVDNRLLAARKVLTSNLSPQEFIDVAAKAVAAEDYRNLFLKQRLLVKRLQEELNTVRGIQPDAEDTGGAGGATQDNDDYMTATTKAALSGGLLK